MARLLIIAGIILITLGLLLHFVPGALNWFGRLPGDIRIESGRTKIYVPIVSMIIISLILTLIVRLFRH
jgi:H+/Cl- antiporter ClcA